MQKMNINNVIKPLLLTLGLLLGALAAQANQDIVIFYYYNAANQYYLSYNGTKVTSTQTFNPNTCIWEFVPQGGYTDRGAIKLKGQDLYITLSGTSMATATSFNVTSTFYWRYVNGQYLYLYNGSRQYYFNANPAFRTGSPAFTSRAGTSTLKNDIPGYDLTHIPEDFTRTIDDPTFGTLALDPATVTLEYKQSQSYTVANLTKTVTITEKTQNEGYTFTRGTTNYKFYKGTNGNFLTSNPGANTVTNTQTVVPTYTWTASSDEYVDITSSGTSGKVKYARPDTENTSTVTITVTATNSYTGLDGPLSDTATATATVTLEKYMPTLDKPTVTIAADGTVTMSHPVEGAQIRYTLDGSIPTESSTLYEGPFKPTQTEYKLNAVAFKTGYYSSAATFKVYPEPTTGLDVAKKAVIINDWEDLDWTYYAGIDDEYRTKYRGTLYSPDARNIIIEYNGSGKEGSTSDVAISALSNENQNVMKYYVTMEKDLATGKYPYTVIPNPFSKRPKVGTQYYGFGGWKIVEGGGKIECLNPATNNVETYNNGDILPLDADINFTSLSNGDDIKFEAVWVPATVVNNVGTSTFSGAIGYSKSTGTTNSYETNFWVVTGGNVNLTNIAKSMTVMTLYYPDGTATGSSRQVNGAISLSSGFNGTLKIEWARMNPNGSNAINPQGRNLYIGRGIANTYNTTNTVGYQLYGSNSGGTAGNKLTINQTLRVESGTYATFTNYGADNVNIIKQHVIFGCDYDRATGQNDEFEIKGLMNLAYQKALGGTSDSELTHVWGKSGKFMSGIEIGKASAENSYYLTVQGTHNQGRRRLDIQGGEWKNIAGGIGNNHDPAKLSFIVRMTGGKVAGSIYGAGQFAGSAGGRLFIFTGGEIGGWVAGGCNGVGATTGDNKGLCDGDSYIYIGGKTKVGFNSITINEVKGGNIFGAGRGDSDVGVNAEVGTVNNSNVVVADESEIENDVYGGGNYGVSLGEANVFVTGGTVSGKVFGGSNMKKGVLPVVSMYGGQVKKGVYGGCNSKGAISEDSYVYIYGGTVGESYSALANVCGGGLGAETEIDGNVFVTIGERGGEGPIIYGDVYGGSQLGDVNTSSDTSKQPLTTSVTMNAGTIKGERFNSQKTDGTGGGGLFGGGLGTTSRAAAVKGNVFVTMYGGTIEDAVYGCSNVNGQPAGSVSVTIYGTDPRPTETTYAVQGVFGGGNQSAYDKVPKVVVNNCASNINYVYGGANATSVLGTDVTINGGTIGQVFGGGNGMKITTTTTTDGTTTTTTTEYPANVGDRGITLAIRGGNIGKVYGGGNVIGTISTAVKKDITVQVEQAVPLAAGDCPIVIGDVYGGGSQADYDGNTIINFISGTQTDNIYGGGALADVHGNTTINLLGGTVHNVYGGGLGNADNPAYVGKVTSGVLTGGNATVTLDGSAVTGSIFGANNENGTPLGHVLVHVKRTIEREGAEYDVPNVYGGGNKAAYIPNSASEYAQVIIDGCDLSSVQYVYGGGNAAPVPATKVYIVGAKKIEYVFGGGNGAGDNNPANVGYKNFDLSPTAADAYGLGTAEVNVYGGKIVDWVFGGSNTKGLIRTKATVNVDSNGKFILPDGNQAGYCDLKIGSLYSAGREATMTCPADLNITCIDAIEEIYGGSYMANVGDSINDIRCDVHLKINSGTYGKIFGGNNKGGRLYGNINITIDETGCKPVVIDEVYGGGNEAEYYTPPATSVNSEGVKAHDPVIDIVSCTSIGKVFGGGYGSTAKVHGNPTVNVQQIPGIYAPGTEDPNDDGRLGTIGSVYGGGNAAEVLGFTTVNIATVAKNTHKLGTDQTTPYDVGANITDSVYGGGCSATVKHETHVTVGHQ